MYRALVQTIIGRDGAIPFCICPVFSRTSVASSLFLNNAKATFPWPTNLTFTGTDRDAAAATKYPKDLSVWPAVLVILSSNFDVAMASWA